MQMANSRERNATGTACAGPTTSRHSPCSLSNETEKIDSGGVVMAALLPGIGMIVGLIMLAKKKPKTGGLMLGASLLSFVVLRLTFALGR